VERQYSLEKTRNIGIMAHIDAGKTTTTERILYYTGRSYKIGEVHEGTATMDWMVQSRSAASRSRRRRPPASGGTVGSTSSTRPATWTSPSRWSARSASSTARSRSSTRCRVSSPRPRPSGVRRDKYRVPRLVYVNKMDRVGADYFQCLDMLRERLGAHPVPIQIPMGREDQYRGLVDLIDQTALVWDEDDETLGKEYRKIEIPADLRDQAKEYRRR